LQTVLRPLALFVALLVAAAACTSNPQAAPAEPEPVTTTTAGTTSTSTAPPAPPIIVTGVPEDLAALVGSIYEHAAGVGDSTVDAAYLPERGIAVGMAGRTASGGVAELAGVEISLIAAGPDAVAAIDDGDGWRVVAVDLPSLDHRQLGFTSAVIAAVGSDARPGEDATRARADSLHLIGFDGVAGTFDIVGIPRDSWVAIPGRSAGKINSALATGGPESMIATLDALAGYPLDGMLLTGFEGFQEASGNLLGGIQITLDAPMSDSASGAVFQAGDQYMNGSQALAFARTRKSLRLGDIDRQRNGGLVLLAAAATAGLRPLDRLPQMISEALGWAWTDLEPETILRLTMTSMVAPIATAGNEVLPGVPGERAGASTIELTSGAHELLTDLADGSLGS